MTQLPSTGPGFTMRNEGLTLTAKLDRNGRFECGYGCQGLDIVEGTVWSEATAVARFNAAYPLAQGAAGKIVGSGWVALDPVRRAAITDMAYELGAHGLAEFIHMLGDVMAGDWEAAADACLTSDYARQVPSRARRVASMLETGAWPGAELWT